MKIMWSMFRSGIHSPGSGRQGHESARSFDRLLSSPTRLVTIVYVEEIKHLDSPASPPAFAEAL